MKIIIIIIAIALTGCASNRGSSYSPLVDRPGPNYGNDLIDCQNHAARLASAGESSIAGAAVGAGLLMLLNAAAGGRGQDNRVFAAAGAFSGGLGSAGDAETSQRRVIANCLRGRGHNVLQ